MAKKEYALAHTKWMCKYHIVFTPKYRRSSSCGCYARLKKNHSVSGTDTVCTGFQ